MAIRTLQSPGVELTERDLSQYSTGAVGTAVLVTGFASKGRDYEPILLTSRSAWLQQFGEPTNEAERYFFNACMEVINQNGMLYACKLPYKNEALNKFTTKTYTVNVSRIQQLSTVAEYATDPARNLIDLLAGNYTEYGYVDPSELSNAWSAVVGARELQHDFKKFADAFFNYSVAIPYAYAEDDWLAFVNIPNCEKDNWMWTPVRYIYDKVSAMFDSGSTFRKFLLSAASSELSDYFEDPERSGQTINTEIDFSAFDFTSDAISNQVSAFADAVRRALGGNVSSEAFKVACDPTTGVNFHNISSEYGTTFTESSVYKFYTANKTLFDALNKINFRQDVERIAGQVPYFYCDDTKFNLGTYWVAYDKFLKTRDDEKYVNETDMVSAWNRVVDLDDFFNLSAQSLATIFDKPMGMINPGEYALTSNPRKWIDEDAADSELKRQLTTKADKNLLAPIGYVLDSFANLFSNADFKALLDKMAEGLYHDSEFAKVAIQYYIDNTIITDAKIKQTLRNSKNLNVFSETFDDGNPDTDGLSTVFQLYNGPDSNSPELSSTTAVIDGAVSQLRYDDFLKFSINFTSSKDFEELSAYADSHDNEYLKSKLEALLSGNVVSTLAFSEIKKADRTVDEYFTIDSRASVALADLETIDGYATGETPVRPNTFVIVDKTRATLGKAFTKGPSGEQKEIVGIIPVVTTAANALYVQALLDTGDSGISKYNAVGKAITLAGAGLSAGPFTIEDSDAAIPFASDNAGDYTVSQMAAASFPSISFTSDGTMDRQNLKKIGVVVLRAFLDPGEGNKVNYDVVEAYAGELDKNAVDPNTGATTFIDNLVNTQSEYIEFYSNCFNQTSTRKDYSKIDLLIVPTQEAGVLGFYEYMTKKNISLTDSILKALPLIWEKNEDINEKQIDLVCDAGVSNIAQYIKSVFNGRAGEYDPASEYATLFKLRSKEDTMTWRAVLAMYDNFCKNIRKDCMFIADGPRPFCLTGNKKIVRPSKPSNTVDGNILPLLKYITGINTNYGAGYCDWFQKSDEFSGDYFWCPPSIQAMGVYLNTDINFDFWKAPAGLNRGVVSALDVAFNPTIRQSNEIYPKCWNYARNYPNDGIVLEGQRTFQSKPTALDRVNVRRAMLRFERIVYNLARWFVYEDNTTYTRQRLYDAVDGVFKEYLGLGAMQRYKIICDESINTPEVIDRNELRVKIGVVPTKSAEFILVEFNVLRQGGSWNEML